MAVKVARGFTASEKTYPENVSMWSIGFRVLFLKLGRDLITKPYGCCDKESLSKSNPENQKKYHFCPFFNSFQYLNDKQNLLTDIYDLRKNKIF